MKIETFALENAFAQFKTSMQYLQSAAAKEDPELRKQFRNSVIQCFEFTYEIAFKMIKRQLSEIVQAPESIKQMNFADIIRLAAQSGLITDVKRFLEYRVMRNITSHTYDENKAELILTVLGDFQQDTDHLLLELKKRN